MPKKKKHPVTLPQVPDPEDETYPEAEPWPEGFDTWTQAQVDAWGLQLLREALAYVPTEEERAIFAHFSRKQESARWVPVPKTEDA